MALTVRETGGGEFELPPAGTYPARCYRVIDLGTQPVEWQGTTKHQQKVLIAWELMGDERMKDGRPFSIQKRYTASLSEKASLRADLEAWRGRPFTGDELRGFHLKNILGQACLLQVIHTEKNGKSYANIASLMRLPKGMQCAAAENPAIWFDLEDPDMEAFDMLGDRLKEVIQGSPEWHSAHGKSPEEANEKIAETEDVPF